MTYEAQETSQEQGAPIVLYTFQYGPDAENVFRYTDFDEEVVHDGQTYHPVTISLEPIKASGGLDNTDITISITPRAPLAEYLQTRSPTQEVAIRVFERHLDDPDGEVRPVWIGRVIASNRGDLYTEVLCESAITSMRRVGLKRSYQRSCPLALYGPECRAARRIRAVVHPFSIGGNFVSVGTDWNGEIPFVKFEGGFITWTDLDTGARHVRTILVMNSDGLMRLDGTTEGIGPDTPLSVYVGCNHLLEDCEEIHANVNNFGGQWKIPVENPVGFINRFF